MTEDTNGRPPKPSRLEGIVARALEQTQRETGATAVDIFASGLSCALAGLALMKIEALPAAVHALGSVLTLLGLLVMVLIRSKL